MFIAAKERFSPSVRRAMSAHDLWTWNIRQRLLTWEESASQQCQHGPPDGGLSASQRVYKHSPPDGGPHHQSSSSRQAMCLPRVPLLIRPSSNHGLIS
jgi:hypothetical protein